MLKRFIILSLGLFLSCSVIAKPQPKPEKCPDLNTVKSAGLTVAENLSGNRYVIFNVSNFGLKELWNFILLPVEGNDQNQALQKGNHVLKDVTGSPTPELDDPELPWFCTYNAPKDYRAIALTWPINNLSVKTLARHLHPR